MVQGRIRLGLEPPRHYFEAFLAGKYFVVQYRKQRAANRSARANLGRSKSDFQIPAVAASRGPAQPSLGLHRVKRIVEAIGLAPSCNPHTERPPGPKNRPQASASPANPKTARTDCCWRASDYPQAPPDPKNSTKVLGGRLYYFSRGGGVADDHL
ncbi:hypothetical protein B484DRAFT_409195 [Ochromonadaceae sp. CCMP2298]|nr:hypothetical protein B484DRAFT_409195 [Ochromonadaceae sp. CCMP2298]